MDSQAAPVDSGGLRYRGWLGACGNINLGVRMAASQRVGEQADGLVGSRRVGERANGRVGRRKLGGRERTVLNMVVGLSHGVAWPASLPACRGRVVLPWSAVVIAVLRQDKATCCVTI